MAGIGIKLNKIYGKQTLASDLVGIGYSSIISIAPMVVVIAAVLLMYLLLGMNRVGYAERELYASTVLYIFIFALLSAAPFNSVLSKYLADVIYEEKYEDILPCYYLGLGMNVALACLAGIPFCLHEYFIGRVALWYVFAGYCGFLLLVWVFYSMLYLSACKDYKRISLYYLVGMAVTVLLALVLYHGFGLAPTVSMLVSLDAGFFIIAILEYALIGHYFRENSGAYRAVLAYFGRYWQLVVANFAYVLGLYVHNMIFWTTDMHTVVAHSFISMTSYDMATGIAMFVNLSATVIFISRVEMHFHERYKAYSEAVIGGRGSDIDNAGKRMFRQLSEELFGLVRIQFIITCVLYFLSLLLLPLIGLGGRTMRMYPCLVLGYFILFIMYAEVVFLYYFNDLNGALMTSVLFLAVTVGVTAAATQLETLWYGIGLVAGAFAGFVCGYVRLRWMEKTMDTHVFCTGTLVRRGHGPRPDSRVYSRDSDQ